MVPPIPDRLNQRPASVQRQQVKTHAPGPLSTLSTAAFGARLTSVLARVRAAVDEAAVGQVVRGQWVLRVILFDTEFLFINKSSSSSWREAQCVFRLLWLGPGSYTTNGTTWHFTQTKTSFLRLVTTVHE
jgi:hypothetical protein